MKNIPVPRELLMLLQLLEEMIQDPSVPDKYFQEAVTLMKQVKEKFRID